MGLILDRVSVRLGQRSVLAEVSARFESGAISVVLGPNGAGKTTLARAGAGLIGYNGTISFGDDDLAAIPATDRARRIGYLPQRAEVSWPLTVAELVALGRLPWRDRFAAPGANDRAVIEQAMVATDIGPLADRPFNTLSGGERARVLLARVMAGEPRWLIADEPLTGLDPAHQIDLTERLRTLAASGVGVVLILHDLNHAMRLADHVVLLRDGRVLAQGSPAFVIAPASLEAAYGIGFELIATQNGAIPLAVPRATR